MLSPRKLIAFLTLALTLSSTFAWADCSSLGSGWVQGTSSGGVTVCVPTGDNPDGAISSGEPVLTQNGKEYYAPPSSMADKLQVDSTGRIARTLDEVTRITRVDGSVYVYSTSATFYTEAGAASTAMWEKVKASPSSYPALTAAVTSASVPPPPAPGLVVNIGGTKYLLGAYSGTNHNSYPLPGTYNYSTYGFAFYGTGHNYEWNDNNYVKYMREMARLLAQVCQLPTRPPAPLFCLGT